MKEFVFETVENKNGKKEEIVVPAFLHFLTSFRKPSSRGVQKHGIVWYRINAMCKSSRRTKLLLFFVFFFQTLGTVSNKICNRTFFFFFLGGGAFKNRFATFSLFFCLDIVHYDQTAQNVQSDHDRHFPICTDIFQTISLYDIFFSTTHYNDCVLL